MLVKTEQLVSADNTAVKITAPEGSHAILNENTVLKVEAVEDAPTENVQANIAVVADGGKAEILASYDISLVLDGASIQPGGAVEVTLPAPENADEYDSIQVVYIDDNGGVTPCETRVNEDGTITFVTDHFSHYAIVGITDAPASASLTWIWIPVIAVVLIAGVAVAWIVIKKKKA